jgi:uncharacterized membrane protein
MVIIIASSSLFSCGSSRFSFLALPFKNFEDHPGFFDTTQPFTFEESRVRMYGRTILSVRGQCATLFFFDVELERTDTPNVLTGGKVFFSVLPAGWMT